MPWPSGSPTRTRAPKLSDESPHHIRVPELRLRIPRKNGDGYFEFPRRMLHWTTEFEDPDTGETYELEYVLAELEKQGWDVHGLTRGQGTFRERVEHLPLPYGGQFSPGNPTRREV